MANELVAIVNPKRKTRRPATKRKKTKRTRRNPTLATVSNPQKKRKRKYRFSSRKWTYRKPRRARRNPAGINIGLESIGFTAGGAIASKMIPSMLPMVRDYNKGIIGLGIQGATGFIISFILGNLLKMKKASQFVLLGTGVNVAITAVDEFLFKRTIGVQGLGFYPNEQLAAYQLDPGMEVGADYEMLEGVDGLQLAGYEEVPLDESLTGLGARAVAVSARRPAVRSGIRTALRPALETVCSGGRFSSRW